MAKNRVLIFHTNPSVIVGLTGMLVNEFASIEGINLEVDSESKVENFEIKALDRPYDLIIADGCFHDKNHEQTKHIS
ncbi:MAG: hypothetical protein MUF12_08170, partial [Sediminibacterium sp.]|nr:hypothetical protein [Sediminibacterium sp.]